MSVTPEYVAQSCVTLAVHRRIAVQSAKSMLQSFDLSWESRRRVLPPESLLERGVLRIGIWWIHRGQRECQKCTGYYQHSSSSK